MAATVQITFRDIPHSNSIETQVQRRAAKLDTFFDRIVSCHVVVAAPHRHHKQGRRYQVSIDMLVPGKELAVTHNLDDDKEDLHATVDNAFTDAERVLEEHCRKLKLGPKLTHQKPPHGVVTKLFSDRGYGFIEDGGREIYFHRNSVLNGKFDKLSVGAKVRYAEEDGDKGPQASTVHVVET
ncbi:HPF/RaiA family ribosome-associated protein [Labilithrix luteola]|uniref:HPF/RaiA family ribosome-associated protein n=1 Tax=Labilithrix luteola TaxID=1391654 RepID=UPI000AF13E71|nr:HPF/RaiA family ribosome-associated protein [Labilithrix luteola]